MSKETEPVPSIATGALLPSPIKIHRTERNQSLDVLRAFAVLGVLGFHLEYYPLWTRSGWIGVDLFFVLSGFLISGLLFQEYKDTGGIKIRRFLFRRGLKIWPSYYLLLIAVGIVYLLDHSVMSRTQLLSNLFVVQNYVPLDKNYFILAHTWTLAVEEHFYLLLPLLFAVLISRGSKQNRFRSIPVLSLAIAIVCLSFRVFALKPWHLAWATHMRIDALFGGVTLGYLRHFKQQWFTRLTGNYSLVIAVLFISPAVLFEQADHRMQSFGLTSLALGFIFLVAWAVVRVPSNEAFIYVARIGSYSYSIYLWHTVFVDFFLLYRPVSLLTFWLYIACCIAGGITMAQLIEIPYLRLRDRLFPATGPRAYGDVGRPSKD